MQTLNVALGDRAYPIHIGRSLLGRADLILPHLRTRRVAIVTNDTVGPLYLEALSTALAQAGVGVSAVSLPDGEAYKDWETLNRIFDMLLAERCERSTTLIALGGGSWATWGASPLPATSAACPSSRCRPRCWPRSTPRWAARRRSIIHSART